MTTPVAIFDFDGTLTRRDSMFPFLRMVAGTPLFVTRMLMLSPVLAAYATKLIKNDMAKEIVLAGFLNGMGLDELRRLGQRFASEQLPSLLHPVGVERLRWHQQQGHACVLVSASLDVYLEPWAREMGFDGWITSSLETDSAGQVHGQLSGGNCFGEEKVRRIKGWIDGKALAVRYAYGDSSGDLPMLKMATEGYLLRKKRFSLVSKKPPDEIV